LAALGSKNLRINIGILNGTVNNNISQSGDNSSGRFKILKDFENKDVYLNLLMSKGMAAIYIRELDMLENCFVDPITRKFPALQSNILN
jgi:hypothetical protein